jgi:hypothetical protein
VAQSSKKRTVELAVEPGQLAEGMGWVLALQGAIQSQTSGADATVPGGVQGGLGAMRSSHRRPRSVIQTVPPPADAEGSVAARRRQVEAHGEAVLDGEAIDTARWTAIRRGMERGWDGASGGADIDDGNGGGGGSSGGGSDGGNEANDGSADADVDLLLLRQMEEEAAEEERRQEAERLAFLAAKKSKKGSAAASYGAPPPFKAAQPRSVREHEDAHELTEDDDDWFEGFESEAITGSGRRDDADDVRPSGGGGDGGGGGGSAVDGSSGGSGGSSGGDSRLAAESAAAAAAAAESDHEQPQHSQSDSDGGDGGSGGAHSDGGSAGAVRGAGMAADGSVEDRLWAEAGGSGGWLDFVRAVDFYATSRCEQETLDLVMALSAVSAPGEGVSMAEFRVGLKLIRLVQYGLEPDLDFLDAATEPPAVGSLAEAEFEGSSLATAAAAVAAESEQPQLEQQQEETAAAVEAAAAAAATEDVQGKGPSKRGCAGGDGMAGVGVVVPAAATEDAADGLVRVPYEQLFLYLVAQGVLSADFDSSPAELGRYIVEQVS